MTLRHTLRGRRSPWRTLEYRKRERYFRIASDVTPYVAVEAGPAVYIVSTHDKNIGRRLFVERRRKEFDHLARAVRAVEQVRGEPSRGVFVDVGANIGTTTLPALVVHGFERVVALEPSPENYKLLMVNLQVNGLADRVAALQVAASDTTASAQLDTSSRNSGAHRLATPGSSRTGLVDVAVTTLDALIRDGVVNPASTGFVWMDVEGHEAAVLRGATSLLAHGVPVVLEVAPKHERSRGLRLEELGRILGRYYTAYVDLRLPCTTEPPVQPIEAFPDLLSRYRDGFTDVLVLREDRD